MNLVYGPIKSLRYGNTLGINLLGSEKVCSYNCVYCSLGPTQLTMNKIRKDYEFPTLDQIRAAFRAYISKSVPTEAVVVSGNGEPTLYPDFDEAMRLIMELRQEHLPGTKVVVLSSGAHLDSKKVVTGMNLADERVVKVDAGNDSLMLKINDPLIRINMAKFLTGVRKLQNCTVQSLFFTGDMDNTQPEILDEWIEVLGMIKPQAVQICTLTRPAPLYPGLRPADEDTLYSIAFKLKKRTTLEASVFSIQKS
jgi:wyosine [tRNA(Phe)-imidazoG37] synthetase (radical SAM superfamily)